MRAATLSLWGIALCAVALHALPVEVLSPAAGRRSPRLWILKENPLISDLHVIFLS